MWHAHGLHVLLRRQTKSKIQENTKTYIQPVGYPHMAPDSLRRYLQVCQSALNLCLLPAPPPGSRQFEGQIQSADCGPFYDWLKKKRAHLNAGVTNMVWQFKCWTDKIYQYHGGKSLPVCMMFLYFIFTWSADRLGAIGIHIFLEEKGYVVGTLRMLNWDINRFMAQILRIMPLTCN